METVRFLISRNIAICSFCKRSVLFLIANAHLAYVPNGVRNALIYYCNRNREKNEKRDYLKENIHRYKNFDLHFKWIISLNGSSLFSLGFAIIRNQMTPSPF